MGGRGSKSKGGGGGDDDSSSTSSQIPSDYSEASFDVNSYKELSRDDLISIAKLAGIPGNVKGTINITQPGESYRVEYEDLSIRMERSIDTRSKIIYNHIFIIKDKNKYKGYEVFNNQVEFARREGYNRIDTIAGKGGKNNYNGYYTWTRLGYRDLFGKNAPVIDRFNTKFNTNITDHRQMMATVEGQQFFKKHGKQFNGRFDLDRNSLSSKMLKNYVEERRKRI